MAREGQSQAGKLVFKPHEAVEIRGTRNGLVIVLDASLPTDRLVSALKAKLATARGFFRGATCELRWRPAPPLVPTTELAGILAEHGLTLRPVSTNIREKPRLPVPRFAPAPTSFEREALFFRGVLRSGQMLAHSGHVVVMGHINAGAVVEAGGHVLVFGKVHGTVHAGWPGNTEAVIIAWHLASTDVAIAGHSLFGSGFSPKEMSGAKMVRLKRGRLRIETWKPSGGGHLGI